MALCGTLEVLTSAFVICAVTSEYRSDLNVIFDEQQELWFQFEVSIVFAFVIPGYAEFRS